MADKKITELSLIDAPIITDIIPVVDDPGGTPVTTKATLAQVADLFKNRTETLTNKTLTSPVINTPTGDVATITGTQTLTNKTLTSPKINENVALTATSTEINLLTGQTALVTASSTTTFTNKRINPRIVSAASYTTDTGTSLDVSTCDEFDVTAQAGALKLNNPGGTPVAGQKLIVRIKDDGTARALTYDTQFRASSDLALPTTTVLSKTLYMGFIWNSADSKWDLVALLNNF